MGGGLAPAMARTETVVASDDARVRLPSPEAIAGYYTAMRRFWHPVMAATDLVEGQPAAVVLLEEEIVLARLNGQVVAMQDTLREQDRRIVESQRPWLLPPFWTKLELPLRPADLPLIACQQRLEELGIALTV